MRTWNWQVRPTVTGAPRAVPPLRIGSGIGSWGTQLMARASFSTLAWYFAFSPVASPGDRPDRGVLGRLTRGDAGHLLEVHPAQEHPTEIDGGQGQQQQNGHHEREFHDALAPRSLTAKTHG